ncbi:MAG: leucine-rich repeat domain-containing protein [Treponema sp.]|jgi:hypothetical protein|nr:leucine-rich repeat domain-containing protein [Treponema sp.]
MKRFAHMMSAAAPAVPVLLALSLVLAACGGGGSGAGSSAENDGAAVETADISAEALAEAALADLSPEERAGKSSHPGGDFFFQLNDTEDGIAIRGYNGSGGAVVVPETIEDIPVVSIRFRAFRRNQNISRVVLPAGIKDIGYEAFSDCTSLTTVVLPAGLETLGYDAFRDCSSLHTVNIPEGIKEIGSNAFNACYELFNLTIPGSLTTIRWMSGNRENPNNGSFGDCGKLLPSTRQRLRELGYTGGIY